MRMRERCGLNKKAIERMANKAYIYGKEHRQTKGKLNKWITSVYFNSTTGSEFRIYGDFLYIFNNDILVTVFRVPNNLLKNMDNYLKE